MNQLLSKSDAILDAAAVVFAEKGYDGARINELAKAAGVNKATLYYQIGDKEALYHAVLLRITSRFANEIEHQLEGLVDPVEQLRQFIDIFADQTGNARYIAPIMLREIASGGLHLPDSAMSKMEGVVAILAQIINRGVSQGIFRTVDPFFVHMLIVGSLNLYAANEPIRKRIKPQLTDQMTHTQSQYAAAQKLFDLIIAAIRNPDHPKESL